MDTIQALSYLIENNQIVAYLFIFLATILEGELVAISAGILVLLGALNFWIALLAIFCGGVIKTFLGYALGKLLNEKFNNNKFFQYLERKVFAVMPHFEQKPFWSIFISKFLMMNHVVILFAGYRRINFKKYLKAELVSTAIWAPSMLLLGYFFSYAAFQVSKKLSEFFLIIILFVIAFFLVEKLISLLYDVFEHILHDHGEKS
jgi:membrane protein DedA with SNARE-associated domain